MTVTDGAIMFAACMGSFIIGFFVGGFRVARLFGRELNKVSIELARHREGLETFYSKLGEDK